MLESNLKIIEGYCCDKIAFKFTNDRYNIVLIERGQAEVIINGVPTTIVEPCCLFVSKDSEIIIESCCDISCQMIVFSPLMINENYYKSELIESLPKKHTKYQLNTLSANCMFTNLEKYSFKKFKRYFDRCLHIMNNNTPNNLFELRRILMLLLFEIEEINERGNNYFEDEEKFLTMTDFINNNIQKLITLDMLKNELFMNKNKIERLFLLFTGDTFGNYYRESKVRHSIYLLTKTSQSIEDISISLGFSNSQNFIRFFKKNKGISPRKFRKYMEKNNEKKDN